MNSHATKLVRALYIFEHRLWDFSNSLGRIDGAPHIDTQYLPGRYWDGDRTRKSRWPKIAERLQELAIDPFAFMPFMFEHHHFINDPPLPNVLLSGKYIDEYLRQTKFTEENVCTRLKMSMRYLHSKYHELESFYVNRGNVPHPTSILESALVDYEQKPSELFRYAIATQQNMPRIAKQIEVPAAREYMRARSAHDVVWGEELLPFDLRQQLAATYRNVLLSL